MQGTASKFFRLTGPTLVFWLKIKSYGMDKRQVFRAAQRAFLCESPLQILPYVRPIVQNRGQVRCQKSILPPRLSLPGRGHTLFQRQRYLPHHSQRKGARNRQSIEPARSVGNRSKWI